jgi:predicted ATPase/DNA-binding winged helix-turn-helix (wHTH) protein
VTEWRFGNVQVLPLQRLLRVDGARVEVGGRALDLLLALIERRDRVVGKDELLDAAWPGLVVEEGNLKAQVSNLRRLLGAEVIATVPGRGYRFAAQIDGDAARPPAPRAALPSAQAPPAPAAPLFGRDDDLAALLDLLQHERLVTVLGPGGIGKTALALAAVRQHAAARADSAVWVDLTSVGDAAAVPRALAQALQADAAAAEDVSTALCARLQARELLLAIDNAEHVVDGVAPLVQALLAGTTRLRVLVTSQAALKLPAEHLLRLDPLSVPAADASLPEARLHGAVQLFTSRVRALQRHFTLDGDRLAAVVEICRRLDGLPLALELAAARVPLLGLRGLAQRLDERLKLLGGGPRQAPTRQQTLQAALDWSWKLLSPSEQAVLRRLAACCGGFTLELAVEVAADAQTERWTVIDILGLLVERSWIVDDGADPPRYRLLDTPRAHALAQLQAADETAATQQRHAQALHRLVLQAEQDFWTEAEAQWLARLAPELDNLRAALAHATAHEPARAVDLIGCTTGLFMGLGLMHEARGRSEALAALLPTLQLPAASAARFLRARSAQMRGVSIAARQVLARQAAACSRAALPPDPRGLFQALDLLVIPLAGFEDEARAALAEMEVLVQPDWPPALRALLPIARSMLAFVDGRLAERQQPLHDALALVQAAGADTLATIVLANLADHALLVGEVDEAVRRGHELIGLLRQIRRPALLPLALCNLANALLQQNRVADARQALAEALAEMRAQQWDRLRGFGDVYALLAASEGRHEEAARLLGFADASRLQRGPRQPNEARCRALCLQRLQGAMDDAAMVRAMAAGAALQAEEVCRLTLLTPV